MVKAAVAIRALMLGSVALGSQVLAAPAAPPVTASKVALAPHRAFYDLKLQSSDGTRMVAAVRGRIMYDFSGSSCQGYALKFRQISDLQSAEGDDLLSDLSSTSWEDGAAKSYRFNSETEVNTKTSDRVDGHADRKSSTVAVTLAEPSGKSLRLPVSVVFPTEHMRKIIAAARAGKKVLELAVYDGSDNGEKVYDTLTVIGAPIAPGEKPADDPSGQDPVMKTLTRWPVTVSYFERGSTKPQAGEQTPAYSISYELYENGVSRALTLAHTDFSISGTLTSLDVKPAKPCK
jgi:hypothetical protein